MSTRFIKGGPGSGRHSGGGINKDEVGKVEVAHKDSSGKVTQGERVVQTKGSDYSHTPRNLAVRASR